MNALFYNDETMHNIYINNGSFDIEYELPKIVASSLISMALSTLLKMLALSNSSIMGAREENLYFSRPCGYNILSSLY